MIKYHTLLIERWWKINSWQHLNCPSVFFHQMKNSPSQDSNPGPRKWFSGHSFEAMYHFISSGIKIFFHPKPKKVCFLFNEKFEFVFNWNTAEKDIRVFCPSLFLSLSLLCALTHTLSQTHCVVHIHALLHAQCTRTLSIFYLPCSELLFSTPEVFLFQS